MRPAPGGARDRLTVPGQAVSARRHSERVRFTGSRPESAHDVHIRAVRWPLTPVGVVARRRTAAPVPHTARPAPAASLPCPGKRDAPCSDIILGARSPWLKGEDDGHDDTCENGRCSAEHVPGSVDSRLGLTHRDGRFSQVAASTWQLSICRRCSGCNGARRHRSSGRLCGSGERAPDLRTPAKALPIARSNCPLVAVSGLDGARGRPPTPGRVRSRPDGRGAGGCRDRSARRS